MSLLLLALQSALGEGDETAAPTDEVALIERARQLDDEAWERIYEQHYPRLYGYLYYRVGDPDLAEDLVAQTFERAVRHIDRFKARGGGLGGWLTRIAQNLAHDHYRRRKARPPDPIELNEAWMGGGGDPTHHALRTESTELLRRALDRLTPDQRDVILLRFIARMTSPEVARHMGKTTGAVKALQHRALAALRRELEALGYHGPS